MAGEERGDDAPVRAVDGGGASVVLGDEGGDDGMRRDAARELVCTVSSIASSRGGWRRPDVRPRMASFSRGRARRFAAPKNRKRAWGGAEGTGEEERPRDGGAGSLSWPEKRKGRRQTDEIRRAISSAWRRLQGWVWGETWSRRRAIYRTRGGTRIRRGDVEITHGIDGLGSQKNREEV